MKYSKKVVNVPEAEYNALMSLVSAGNMDPLSREKYETDVKIQQNFRKPMLSQLEKNVKYQSLNRKRKMLSKMIDNKPIKIIVENAKTETPAPTEGIAPAQKPKNNVQDAQQVIAHPEQAEKLQNEPAQQQQYKTNPTVDKFKGIVKSQLYYDLKDYVDDNKVKFGITANGGIVSNKSRYVDPIPSSDYVKALKYMTGDVELHGDEKYSAWALIKRLARDDTIKELFTQEGHGRKRRKRFLFQLKTRPIKESKTRGLIRAFKPVLWTKIPI